MSETANNTPAVAMRDLPPVRVAYLDCPVNLQTGDFGEVVREGFNKVKAWVLAQGLDPNRLLAIGAMQPATGYLQHYECCVELPDSAQTPSEDIGIKVLAGGRYAVLSIEKEDETIRRALAYFQQEYVPQQHLTLDHTRATYEIYYERTMDFCVPVVQEVS